MNRSANVILIVALAGSACGENPRRDAPNASTPATLRLTPVERIALEREAFAGVAQAAVRVSEHYTFADPDPFEAIYWLHLAALHGDTSAQYNLGFMLRKYGRPDQASLWFQSALQESKGTTREEALQNLHEIQESACLEAAQPSPSTPKSIPLAFEQLEARAQRLDPQAAFELSTRYLTEKRDPARHLSWLRLAASLGHCEAQVAYAVALHRAPETRAEAARWLQTSLDTYSQNPCDDATRATANETLQGIKARSER